VDALRHIDEWPVEFAAAGVARVDGVVATRGPRDAVVRLASVSKLVTALATLVAAEEDVVDLDEPAGPPGSTVRHLLAHASGLPFEGPVPLMAPGVRRVYSNEGFRVLAEHVAVAADMPFDRYVRAAVVEPLGIGLRPTGHPGAGMHACLDDVLALGRELLAPTTVAAETLREATTVQFAGLRGVLPGFGRYDPLDWGLGVDLRDAKSPYWMGERNSPRAFGHFGGSGTFLWVDPDAKVACAALTTRDFGEWAKSAWPRLSDAVLEEAIRL
jgi:CubicO group peptidase (beta-lactamase class C family)